MSETKVISTEEKIKAIEGMLDEILSNQTTLVFHAKSGKYYPVWQNEFEMENEFGECFDPKVDGEILDTETGEAVGIKTTYKAVDLDSLYDAVKALHLMQERAGELGL